MEAMKHARRKSFVLISSLLVTLLGAWAMSRSLTHKRVLPPSDLPKSIPSRVSSTKSLAAPPTAPAPTVSIDSAVIPGGGGASTSSAGSNIKVEGAIGQTAAGDTSGSSNGQFSVTGGYWLAEATPSPSPNPSPSPTPTPTPNLAQFSAANYTVTEDCTTVTITVNRTGDTSGAASVDYFTADVTASERRDYITALGKLHFAPAETSRSFVVLINEDSYVEGPETFTINLANPIGVNLGSAITTVRIDDDPVEPPANLIDDPRNYVCQHYHDFLNREPDTGGWDFWSNQITSCGNDVECNEVRRINVSASFFLSIEFQQSGYLVERFYKVAYGDAPGTSTFPSSHQLPVPVVSYNEFLRDTRRIGQGVVVLAPGWEQLLENNKQTYAVEFVQTTRFLQEFPNTMTPAEFVDKLNQNAGNVLSASERSTSINFFSGAGTSSNPVARSQAVRQVAEDLDLYNAEFNRAFVLAQYFGYLRRNPNDPPESSLDYTGFDFWLTKLNQFNGNYLNAEMVKAFLFSIEYRQRFGP
jgi:hypothetical protein